MENGCVSVLVNTRVLSKSKTTSVLAMSRGERGGERGREMGGEGLWILSVDRFPRVG